MLRRIAPAQGRHGRRAADATSTTSTRRCRASPAVGTMAWKLVGFPLDEVTIRAKTGSAEVYGKQSTGWVASYTEDYVVVMMISQGGTGSGSTGDGDPQDLGDALRRRGRDRAPRRGRDPRHRRRRRRCRSSSTTARSCRRPTGRGGVVTPCDPARARHRPAAPSQLRAPASTGCSWSPPLAPGRARHPAGLVGDLDPRRPHRRRRQRPTSRKQLVNVAIGLVLMVVVLATDHRWVRILAPLVYLGCDRRARPRARRRAARSTARARGSSSAACPSSPRSSPSSPSSSAWRCVVAERTERRWGRARRQPRGGRRCSLIAGVPAALILLQPDLGTMLVLTATVFGVLAVAGARRRWLVGLDARRRSPARSWRCPLGVLKDYQVDRFLAFTNPGLDPRGRRLQHRAGADRGRQRRPVRPGPLRRLADPLGLRARAAHRLHLHRRRRGARPRRAPAC